MNITTCLVVKNETSRIERTLELAMRVSREVIVVDTGSTDGTQQLIESKFGLEVYPFVPESTDPFNIVDARNFALSKATSPWILTLDADERISDESIAVLRALDDNQEHDGFFGEWCQPESDGGFSDYKLFIFRNGIGLNFLGRVHSVPQTFLRFNNRTCGWIDGLRIRHDKESKRTHRDHYSNQMLRGISENPDWIRYHWFLGYSMWSNGISGGRQFLERAADSQSAMFPVECLNAALHLAWLDTVNGDFSSAEGRLESADSFLSRVANDCEVKINCYNSWFDELSASIKMKRTLKSEQRRFAF